MTGLEHYSTSCYNNKNCYGHLKNKNTIKLSIPKVWCALSNVLLMIPLDMHRCFMSFFWWSSLWPKSYSFLKFINNNIYISYTMMTHTIMFLISYLCIFNEWQSLSKVTLLRSKTSEEVMSNTLGISEFTKPENPQYEKKRNRKFITWMKIALQSNSVEKQKVSEIFWIKFIVFL